MKWTSSDRYGESLCYMSETAAHVGTAGLGPSLCVVSVSFDAEGCWLLAAVFEVSDFGFAFGVDRYDEEVVELLLVNRRSDVAA